MTTPKSPCDCSLCRKARAKYFRAGVVMGALIIIIIDWTIKWLM